MDRREIEHEVGARIAAAASEQGVTLDDVSKATDVPVSNLISGELEVSDLVCVGGLLHVPPSDLLPEVAA